MKNQLTVTPFIIAIDVEGIAATNDNIINEFLENKQAVVLSKEENAKSFFKKELDIEEQYINIYSLSDFCSQLNSGELNADLILVKEFFIKNNS